MIDLIELIGSFSAEIFGVEIRVGGRSEKILGENNPIKSIKSITGSQTAAIWLTTAKKYIVTQQKLREMSIPRQNRSGLGGRHLRRCVLAADRQPTRRLTPLFAELPANRR